MESIMAFDSKTRTLKDGRDDDVELTIVSVNFNSSEFILESLRAIEHLTLSKWKMVICDNGSAHEDFVRLRNGVTRYQNVTLLARTQTEFGSSGHGEALNLLVRFIDTRYGAILDADCLPLMFGWDTFLIGKIDAEVKIAGTPVAHNTPGDSKRDRSFPLMFLCLFDATAVKIGDIDFRPGNIAKGEDTGWRMREIIERQGYKGYCLFGQNTRSYNKGPLAATICDEYYPDEACDQLVCAHFGRGSNPRSGKYKIGGVSHAHDKSKWLRACATIIDGEIERAIKGGRLPCLDFVDCPACGSMRSTKVFTSVDRLFHTPGFWNVVRCSDCGLSFTNPRPSVLSIGDYYPDDYGPYHGAPPLTTSQEGLRALLRRQTQRQHFGYFADQYSPSLLWRVLTWPLIRIFKSNLLPPLPPVQAGRRLLEIGCAHGERLRYLRTLGWDVQGVELSDLAASRAREKGLPCITSSIEDCSLPEGSFDVIIMSMVLEHLSDPLAALGKVNRWLKPGGKLLLSVPNDAGLEARLFKEYGYSLDVPRHLTHFTPETLGHVLAATGFDVFDITYQGFHRDLKSGLEHYVQDHPRNAWMLKAPVGVFKFGGLLLGLLRMSSRISVSAVRRGQPSATREA